MAVKRDERRLIVASERPIKHSKLASLSLIHVPDTEVVMLQGMINIIISEQLYDKEFVSSSTEGFERLQTSAARYSPEFCEQVTGINRDTLREAARLIAGSKRLCILLSTGLGIPADDEKLGVAVANLALLTGMVKREGCGVAFLGEKCNSQGALDMGLVPRRVYPPYTLKSAFRCDPAHQVRHKPLFCVRLRPSWQTTVEAALELLSE